MAFQQFKYPDVERDLGLRVVEADLFSPVEPMEMRDDFLAHIAVGVNLAGAISTEKARSEFVVAPVLIELRRRLPDPFAVFSGVELNADLERGLNGTCDFILSKSPRQQVLSTPLLTIIEAKNGEIRNGFGPCIAAMVAARIVNEQSGETAPTVYGAVTNGSVWKFLQLRGDHLTFDLPEYLIGDLPKLMGILRHIIRSAWCARIAPRRNYHDPCQPWPRPLQPRRDGWHAGLLRDPRPCTNAARPSRRRVFNRPVPVGWL